MNNYKITTLLLAMTVGNSVFAQDEARPSGSLYLITNDKSDVVIPFMPSGEGHRFTPTWGMDMAWYDLQNLKKGINHIGRDNIGIGRIAYRYSDELINDSALSNSTIAILRNRAASFNRVRADLPLVLTADQGVFEDGKVPVPEYYVKNKATNIPHWTALINSHVHWLQANSTHPVIGVSPYNEPDYWSKEEGASPARQAEIARLLKANYPRMKDVNIVGANTLNNDQAWNWFSNGSQYYDWGNTHQLAGSFDTYASFFEQLAQLGKVGYADEMHNVGEAMVGLEYGMNIGIWWGFDSRARGEFCDISRNGERLAYGEHRNNWTSASVYRHDDGRVKAFIGSSERQAYTTSFLLVTPEHDVYYDGYGPVREVRTVIPGGTGYQNGQTNAERVIDITWGEDVPPMQITEGTYILVNKATGNVATVSNGNINQTKFNKQRAQQWTVKPATNRCLGDLSFYDIESLSNAKTRMNVLNNSTDDNADIIAYTHNDAPLSNEQWYLEYVGNGYYYIRSRETALYLSSFNRSTNNQVNIIQRKKLEGEDCDLQLWRILPSDVTYETTAPAQPQQLSAQANTASVRLSWTANSEDDLDGYMVLRSPAGQNQWNTIARRVSSNYYTDNTCSQGVAYDYKVKAIDKAQNLSEPSATISATPTGEHAMIARWQMDGDLQDVSHNMMDAVANSNLIYVSDHKQGEKALRLSSTSYVQLPYESANSNELTVALWVKWSTASNWQRIFDFGNGTNHYMFLTPSNGSVMRFAIKNGGEEQQVDCKSKLATGQWKHVAVSIGEGKTTIYIDGEEAASSTAVTIRPSDVHPVLNYLGRSQFNADPYFLGSIDDVRIYNYALNSDEVKQVMGDTASGIETVAEEQPQNDGLIYGIDGRKHRSLEPGVNIVNGRKIVVR